jgi:cation diffusion facilitator family transporter
MISGKFIFSEFLIRKAGLAGQDTENLQIRSRFGYLEGWVSLTVNLLLFGLKLAMAFFSGSISIIADAVHTLSDVGTSAAVIWGFKIAQKPADKDHPFGHGRMEDIITLIIAVVLSLVGLELLHGAVLRFLEPVEIKADHLILVFLVFSVGVKEWLARFSFYLGSKIGSSALNADAWHHRSDAISTILVIIAVAGSMFDLFWLDALFGGLVALYIMYTGIKLIRESAFHLLGKAADKKLISQIRKIALSVVGVQGVHDIVAHDYGQLKAISLHVEVQNDLQVEKAHQIATSVETKIAKNINSRPIVHIDISRKKKEKKSAVTGILDKVFEEFPDVIEYHDFDMLSNETGDFLNLHVVISKLMKVDQSHQLEHRLAETLAEKFNDLKINIHVEPCDSKCSQCPLSCKDV